MGTKRNPAKPAKHRTEREDMAIRAARDMDIYKRDDMIQKARCALTVQEQRCVLFAISKIRPEDKGFEEYTVDLRQFYDICGLDADSYTHLKAILKGLADKSWWAVTDKEKGTESLLRWFTTLRANKRSGKVTIKFHEDMMPYLLELARQAREDGLFYTHFGLRYILPMRGQHSPRLYEILKSYQKNQREWFFEIDDLKYLLNCQSYKNFNDFKRFVLDPAVREINEFTDIKVGYDLERKGRGGRIVRVNFFLAAKPTDEITATNILIETILDGQLSFDDLDTPRKQFRRENATEDA